MTANMVSVTTRAYQFGGIYERDISFIIVVKVCWSNTYEMAPTSGPSIVKLAPVDKVSPL